MQRSRYSRKGLGGAGIIVAALFWATVSCAWLPRHMLGKSWSCVSAVLALSLVLAGIVLCILSLDDIRRSKGRLKGSWLAITGLILPPALAVIVLTAYVHQIAMGPWIVQKPEVTPPPRGAGAESGPLGRGWVFAPYWGGEYRLFVFTDIPRRSTDMLQTGVSMSMDDGIVSMAGRQYSQGAKKVLWRAVIREDGAGHISINQRPFDISSGRVFLVATSGPASQVTQMQLGTSVQLTPAADSLGHAPSAGLRSFAEETPRVAAFLWPLSE